MKRWALLAVLLAGCDRQYPPPPLPSEVVDFTKLYTQNCTGCHGVNGRWGAAPPLHDRLFLSIVSDDELREVIQKGRAGTMMPGFHTEDGGRILAPDPKGPPTSSATVQAGPLTDKQVEALVQGMRKEWGQRDLELAATYGAILGDKMDGDAKRGQTIFQNACATCHGEKGEGVKGYAGALNEPAFLALISPQEIRRIIFTGRPEDLKMPNYKSSEGRNPDFKPLNPQDIADVAAFVLTWRQSLSQVADK
jgi:cytochrome c oxidase cbb3-type subunit 3